MTLILEHDLDIYLSNKWQNWIARIQKHITGCFICVLYFLVTIFLWMPLKFRSRSYGNDCSVGRLSSCLGYYTKMKIRHIYYMIASTKVQQPFVLLPYNLLLYVKLLHILTCAMVVWLLSNTKTKIAWHLLTWCCL